MERRPGSVPAARGADSHIVHVGVSAAPDTTIVHFGWHQLIEAYIERSGLAYTHLWPAAFMQTLRLGVREPGPWRYEPVEPREFYDAMVAAGADPVYLACVRNVFERMRDGSLVDPTEGAGTIEAVTGQPATSIREFLHADRELFAN
ncbi:MAG TPA: hypothetical protein VIL37_10860 [Natronosporangium sp.]